MPVYLGTKKLACGYLGTKKLEMGYFDNKQVCGDDGLVHFPDSKSYYIQAFKGTARRLGITKYLQFYTFSIRHFGGDYPLINYRKQVSRLDQYLEHYFTTPNVGKIEHIVERAQSGYRDRCTEEFDLYDMTSGKQEYIGTGHFKDWHNWEQQICTWSRVNEFLPLRPARYFRMEVFVAKSYHDLRKLYFPKITIEDMNGAIIKMTGNNSYSSPQDSGSTVQNLFDGHSTTFYNSVNSIKPIIICFEASDHQEHVIKEVTVMAGRAATDQVPATFRISACDSSYNRLWEVAMVKEPAWDLGFAYKTWNTQTWPATLINTYVF